MTRTFGGPSSCAFCGFRTGESEKANGSRIAQPKDSLRTRVCIVLLGMDEVAQGETNDLALALERSVRSLHPHLILVNRLRRIVPAATLAQSRLGSRAPLLLKGSTSRLRSP